MSFLWRAQLVLFAVPVLYVVFLCVLTVPAVQRALIFVSWANVPSPSTLASPEAHGFAPGQVRNLNVSTPDGVHLGAWHVLPYADYLSSRKHGVGSVLPLEVYCDALRSRRTLLYAHGNAGNRATGHRQRIARFVSHMDVNFVTFDYRGFGDSSKHITASEAGLVADARAMWDWLRDQDVDPSELALAGTSLGTGVVSGLAAALAREGVSPRALVLMAPFTSIPHLLETYKLGTVVPLLGPLTALPGVHRLLLRYLTVHFNTRAVIRVRPPIVNQHQTRFRSAQSVSAPILLIHATDDRDIAPAHSEALFADLAGDDAIATVRLGDDGSYVKRAGRATLLRTTYGKHNAVGYGELALLYLREVMLGEKAP